MSKIIAICGKICSGKSWYAKKLCRSENAVIMSTDEVTYDLTDNKQGEGYDDFSAHVNAYLMKKSAEIVKAGCTVILDWGFWTRADRKNLSDYFNALGIEVEWHYIDIDDRSWEENISQRNQKVKDGFGGSDFYVDQGLKEKLLNRWEEPTKDEIDVWHVFSREDNT